MYNGIGLQTARGSGTNGYVQRNMSFVPRVREKTNYRTEEDIKKLDALANKKPNLGILEHDRKRNIELKCVEMQELMENEGYADEDIETKVSMFRQMLMESDHDGERDVKKDEFGRPLVKESHQIAEANQQKNAKMREALGISQYFVDGSSLDPERKAKEAVAAAAEEAKKKYELIQYSSDAETSLRKDSPEIKKVKKDKKKSESSHEKIESTSKKKKSPKKNRRDRSVTPNTHTKKKSKQVLKDKGKYKSKQSESSKKRHSSTSSSDSSSEADSESSSRSSSSSSSSYSDTRKPKSSKKHDKTHKEQRRRSMSTERVRYNKDVRSRKDIYEAKKQKHLMKTTRESSSSQESSSNEYFRLEPLKVKSKSMLKNACQIIAMPKKSTSALSKYEKKKRSFVSSSSEDEKQEKKQQKLVDSHYYSKKSKHMSDSDDVIVIKTSHDARKLSKKFEKGKTSRDKHHRHRSRSDSEHNTKLTQKGYKKTKTYDSEDESDYKSKGKEYSNDHREDRYYITEKNNKDKHREMKSQKSSNGNSKNCSSDSDSSYKKHENMLLKHKKTVPKSPSHSPPPIYKHKTHVILSPMQDSVIYKKKIIPRSPSLSPPRKHSSHRSYKLQESSPDRHSRKRHDSGSSSHSLYLNRHYKKKANKEKKQDGYKIRLVDSESRSPSPAKGVHKKRKRKTSSESSQADHLEKSKRKNKKKEEVRNRNASSVNKALDEYANDKNCHSEKKKSKSPLKIIHYESSHSKDGHSSDIMQLSDAEYDRNIIKPRSPEKIDLDIKEIKVIKKHSNFNEAIANLKHVDVNKMEKEKLIRSQSPASDSKSKHRNQEKKVSNSNELNVYDDCAIEKNTWNAVTQHETAVKSLQNCNISSGKEGSELSCRSPVTKELPCVRKETKDIFHKGNASRSPYSSHSRSPSENKNLNSADGNQDLKQKNSRSRSRSRSRSHSYRHHSKSRSKSYSNSRSRSKSYSKSVSSRKSRSKTRSRSRSRSYSNSSESRYSRSRSRSYSSRSRSRSAGRSSSIPRRRGSPSFLDKRRITS